MDVAPSGDKPSVLGPGLDMALSVLSRVEVSSQAQMHSWPRHMLWLAVQACNICGQDGPEKASHLPMFAAGSYLTAVVLRSS